MPNAIRTATRKATRSDIPALVALKSDVAREAYSSIYGSERVEKWIAKNCTDAWFDYRLAGRGYEIVVAERGGEVVGMGVMRRRGVRADMSGLYVKYPGCGIGREIATERIRIAREMGCTHERASVFRENDRAIDFVTRRGLTATGGGFSEEILGTRARHYEGELGSPS